MNNYTQEQIKKKASELIDAAGVTDEFPVPLSAILDHLNYHWVQFQPNEKTAGVAGAVNHQQHRVYTNAYDIPQRQRFTAAHEIGHIVLHEGENVVDLRVTTTPYDTPEADANSFAAELLMPEGKFRELREKKKYTRSQLADFFGVSHQSVEVRLNKLSLS